MLLISNQVASIRNIIATHSQYLENHNKSTALQFQPHHGGGSVSIASRPFQSSLLPPIAVSSSGSRLAASSMPMPAVGSRSVGSHALHPSDSEAMSNDDAEDDADEEFADDGIDDEDLDDDDWDEDEDDNALAHLGKSSGKRRIVAAMAKSASTTSELMFSPQSFSASLRAQTMTSRQSSLAMRGTVADESCMGVDDDEDDESADGTDTVDGRINNVSNQRANVKPTSASAKR